MASSDEPPILDFPSEEWDIEHLGLYTTALIRAAADKFCARFHYEFAELFVGEQITNDFIRAPALQACAALRPGRVPRSTRYVHPHWKAFGVRSKVRQSKFVKASHFFITSPSDAVRHSEHKILARSEAPLVGGGDDAATIRCERRAACERPRGLAKANGAR